MVLPSIAALNHKKQKPYNLIQRFNEINQSLELF